MTARATEYFYHLGEYRVAVCKECRHAVWVDQVRAHLQGRHHGIGGKGVEAIADEVREFPGLIRFPGEFEVPAGVDKPIPELPIYADGLMCELQPDRCRYICRNEKAMKKHWRVEHQWSAGRQKGGSGKSKADGIERRFQEAVRRVHCQRFFTSRHGSQYFEVWQPAEEENGTREDGNGGSNDSSRDTWTRAWQQMQARFEQAEKEAAAVVQDAERDQANPWLERTQWQKYLVGKNREDLSQCIVKPGGEEDEKKNRRWKAADKEKDDPNEPIETAVWQAMEDVARISQESVAKRAGVSMRMQAIRTEKHQTRYQPFQPYMDEESIKDRTRSWEQVLMFFMRTQRQHDWDSPAYKFTRSQFEAFVRLVEEAEREVEGGEDGGESHKENEDNEEAEEEGEGEGDEEGSETNEKDEEKWQKLTPIQRACLDFCIELLNQRFVEREYESALVCAAAVLGVDPTDNSWRGPETYGSILSALIKVAHFMVIQKAFEVATPAEENEHFSASARPCDFEDSGYESGGSSRSGESSRRAGRSGLQWVNKMMDDFMVRGSDSPMQWFLDLRAYGMKIHFNTTAKGHVGWRDRDVLEYKNISFSMAQFRGMVHGLAQGTAQVLVEDLLFCKRRQEVPAVPWHSMHDDPTNGRRGWNFLQDQRNRFPVDGRSWLFERIMENGGVRRRFTRQGTASGLNREAVSDWMSRVAAFKEKLLVLMHITGGQPARGPEILSIRHSNTAEAGHRHIFIEDGMVVFVTRYHKGYALQGDVKVIHRYLPREVGELLVWYLWLVLPFQQRIEVLIRGKQQQGQQQEQQQQEQEQSPPLSAHLWAAEPGGKKWTTERMRQAIKRETAAGLGHEVTVRAYRDIAIAISRQWIRGPTAFRQDDGEGDDSEQRQDEDGMAAAIADAQAGHTSHVAGIVYARGIMEQLGWVAERRQQFRACSIDWHRFLGFESTGQADERNEAADSKATSKKRKRCPFEEEAEEERLDRWIRLNKMNGEEQLRQLVGKEAVFRSVQKPALDAIKAGHSPVVAVMPTGAGKSVLFTLPAWAEPGGTTVVVVPLKSLRKDMKRRCDEAGVRCAVWGGRRQADAESIVLVTPEAAVGEEFGTFLKRIRRTRQLDRIVVDECHVVLNDRVDFRKHLQQLGKLAGVETQMVLLTATLPVAEESRLYKRMGWRADEVKIFRGPTVRKNVRYRVVGRKESSRKEQEDLVAELVERELRASAEGKVVVYCKTRGEVERLAKAGRFVCEEFRADMSERRKDEVLEDFRAGRERVVVATSALGMGIDIPGIRLIVHAGEPRSMMDYGQESGRAGRDGGRSEAVIIRGGSGLGFVDDGRGEGDDELVRRYTDPANRQCRRIIMDEYFDGRTGRTGCEEGEERCDNCGEREGGGDEVEEGGGDEVEEGEGENVDEDIGGMEQRAVIEVVEKRRQAEREQAEREQVGRERDRAAFRGQERQRARPYARQTVRAQGERQEMERMEWQLRRWRGVCGVCKAAGRPAEHGIGNCRSEGGRRAEGERREAGRRIRYDRYSGCFGCGAPQSMCDRWESNEMGGWRRTGRECQFSGVLLAAVYGIKHGYEAVWRRWLQKIAAEEGVVEAEEGAGVVGFLGRKRDTAEVESNNLVWEFLWLAERVDSIEGEV